MYLVFMALLARTHNTFRCSKVRVKKYLLIIITGLSTTPEF